MKGSESPLPGGREEKSCEGSGSRLTREVDLFWNLVLPWLVRIQQERKCKENPHQQHPGNRSSDISTLGRGTTECVPAIRVPGLLELKLKMGPGLGQEKKRVSHLPASSEADSS
ncbi:LOW QUALITY PROTEIN: hypothetical protein MC885_006774, partial [Smutsia gigantea]